jgi:hypothetical protein
VAASGASALAAWCEAMESDKTCLSSPKLEELSLLAISFEDDAAGLFQTQSPSLTTN